MDRRKDYKRFLACMAVLQENFTPDKDISEQKVEMFFRAFNDWTIEQFETACQRVLNTKKISTFPLIAEIREALTDKEESLKAWLMARDAVARYGPWMSVKFPNPIIHSVIEAMGGWTSFCDCPDKERVWKQKEFERLYTVMQWKDKHPAYVVGYHELNNTASGYKDVNTLIDYEEQLFLETELKKLS